MMHALNLFAHVLDRARRYQHNSQYHLAESILLRLARFRDLPDAIAEQIDALLGEGYLRRRRFRAARRHLRAALRRRPCARTYYLLALALHHDPRGDRDRAACFYRRALRLSPRWVRCLTEAGLLDVARGRTDRGIRLLRRAAALAPDDVTTLTKLVRGLCQSGKPREAHEAVRVALFRAPRCPKVRKLADNLHLSLLRRRQETARIAARPDAEPVVLPFMRVVGLPPMAGDGIRHDGAAALPGPHLVRLPVLRSRRTAR